jgi:hypothetical protein
MGLIPSGCACPAFFLFQLAYNVDQMSLSDLWYSLLWYSLAPINTGMNDCEGLHF